MNVTGLRHVLRAPDAVSVKDAGQTLVVDEVQGRWWWLRGAEATVWDLLVLGYGFQHIAGFLGLLLSCGPQEAGEVLGIILQEWEQAGLVSAVEEGDGG